MAEREKDYLYSDLLYGGIRSVYAKANSGIDPGDIDSFRGRSYCVPAGFLIYPQMEQLLKEGAIKMQRSLTLVSCAKMLALDRVDFYITDSVTGDMALLQADVGPAVTRLAKPFDRAEFYLIVPAARPAAQALIDHFNKGIKALRAKGEYEAIVKRHLR